MRARNVRNAERLTEHTVRLQPLKVDDRVSIYIRFWQSSPIYYDQFGLQGEGDVQCRKLHYYRIL